LSANLVAGHHSVYHLIKCLLFLKGANIPSELLHNFVKLLWPLSLIGIKINKMLTKYLGD
jgi:hypothetical protein